MLKMGSEKIYTRAFRLRKAYWTTTVVLFSYFRLWFLKKIRGQSWYDARILALHVRNAERVRDAILQLKGLFVKLGQMLSILSNFLPEAFQKPLEALQDQMPPRPFPSVQARILRELGKPIETVFAHFEEKPIAAASIGQVHRARLHDGTEVVVKIQHIDIESVAQIDLEIIRRLTRLIAWFMDIKGMDYVYTQVRKMIEEELDFTREANSMERVRLNLAEAVGITVPIVHRAFSTSKVITSTWHQGVKISNLQQLDDWKIDRRQLATVLLKAYCRMLFKDGFYHADPHPGNILVQQDGTMVLLDFGAVAAINPNLLAGIPQLIEAAVRNDTTAMVTALNSMGFIAQSRDSEQMAEKMLQAVRNFLQNEVQFEGLNFKDIEIDPFNNSLYSLIQEIGFNGIAGTVQVPKDYVLLSRMITLLLGLCNTLDPNLNPLDVVRPYGQQYLLGEKEGIFSYVSGMLRRNVATALGLPDELHQVLQKAKKGTLEVNNLDVRNGARLLYYGVQQLIFALLLIATVVLGFAFWKANNGEYVRFAGFASAFWLLMLFRTMRKGEKYL
jgi:ubiquinone biosynthesis protein